MSVMVDYVSIGKNIRKHRLLQNLTQEELAERAGICQQFLGKLELGKGIPSLQTVLSLCQALSITSNDLVDGCAAYDPDAPCTLRDDTNPFPVTLTDILIPRDEPKPAAPQDDAYPPFDITLDDPF